MSGFERRFICRALCNRYRYIWFAATVICWKRAPRTASPKTRPCPSITCHPQDEEGGVDPHRPAIERWWFEGVAWNLHSVGQEPRWHLESLEVQVVGCSLHWWLSCTGNRWTWVVGKFTDEILRSSEIKFFIVFVHSINLVTPPPIGWICPHCSWFSKVLGADKTPTKQVPVYASEFEEHGREFQEMMVWIRWHIPGYTMIDTCTNYNSSYWTDSTESLKIWGSNPSKSQLTVSNAGAPFKLTGRLHYFFVWTIFKHFELLKCVASIRVDTSSPQLSSVKCWAAKV